MAVKEENVLLACLSKVDFTKNWTKYKYKEPNGDEIEVEGLLTNEAPAKIVLSLVEKLDRVVTLCSTEVNKSLEENREFRNNNYLEAQSRIKFNDESKFEGIDENRDKANKDKTFLQHTHYEYYKQVLTDFAISNGKDVPQFYSVSISNNPEEYDIAKTAIEAAEDILGDEEGAVKIHLYIDYNSGPRYIASMLLNTANLMEQRGVIIENILTMNYENKVGDYVPVESLMAVLQSSRLVSGIKEYIDYGRNGELVRYFAKCKDDKVKKILDKMGTLSFDLQMCDTEKIFGGDNLKSLEKSLKDYIQMHKNDIADGTGDSFSILFNYVANDILEGYKPLFAGDLLDIIDWCREKDYLQQAVTFYAERMPIYFWDKHIYYPSDKELAEYEKVKTACDAFKEEKEKSEFRTSKRNQQNLLLEKLAEIGSIPSDIDEKSKKAYVDNIDKNHLKYNWQAAWMEKYLKYGYTQDYDWIPKKIPDGKTAEDMKVEWRNKTQFDVNGNGRTCSICDDAKLLGKVLRDYGKIKTQRNKIAHADDESGRWPYKTMTTNLKNYVADIRNLMKTYGGTDSENISGNS